MAGKAIKSRWSGDSLKFETSAAGTEVLTLDASDASPKLGDGFMALGVAAMPSGFSSATGAIPGIPSARALMVVGVMMALLNFSSRIGFAYLAQAVSLPLALSAAGVALIAAAAMAGVTDSDRVAAHGFTRR